MLKFLVSWKTLIVLVPALVLLLPACGDQNGPSDEGQLTQAASGDVTFAWKWFAGCPHGKKCHAEFGPNKRWELILQGDGNLVLYDLKYSPRKALWSSCTNGRGFDGMRFQSEDGNLVIYRAYCQEEVFPANWVCYLTNSAIWASHTCCATTRRLMLQYDGNLVIYDGSIPVWTTYTNGGAVSKCGCGGCKLR